MWMRPFAQRHQLLVLIGLILLTPANSFAKKKKPSSPKTPPKKVVRTLKVVTNQGQVVDTHWPVIEKWEWLRTRSKVPGITPRRRLYIVPPKESDFVPSRKTHKRFIYQGSKGYYFKLRPREEKVEGTKIKLRGKKKLEEVTLLLPDPVAINQFLVHSSCEDEEIYLQTRHKKLPSKQVFTHLGISCPKRGQIIVHHPSKFRVKASSLPKRLASGKSWVQYSYVGKPKGKQPKDESLLGAFALNSGLVVSIRKNVVKLKDYAISAALGASSLSYQQTGVSDYSQIALVVKAAYSHFLYKRIWRVAANVFSTPLAISSSQSGTSAMALGANARVGYVAPFVKKPWTLAVDAGFYFGGLFVTNSAFGYQVFGWTMFPSASLKVGPKDTVSMYMKFAPMGQSLSFSMDNAELAGGFSWLHDLKGGRKYSVNLDVANLGLTSSVQTIKAFSISLSGGFHW